MAFARPSYLAGLDEILDAWTSGTRFRIVFPARAWTGVLSGALVCSLTMASDDADATLACWAWLTESRAHAHAALARTVCELTELHAAGDTADAMRAAMLAHRIRDLEAAERACLDAAKAGDPWRVWDRYTGGASRAEVRTRWHRDLEYGPPLHRAETGRDADNARRYEIIREIHRVVSTAIEADRDLAEHETHQIMLMLAGLDGTIPSLSSGPAIDASADAVRAVFRESKGTIREKRAIVATSELLDSQGASPTRIRQILAG